MRTETGLRAVKADRTECRTFSRLRENSVDAKNMVGIFRVALKPE